MNNKEKKEKALKLNFQKNKKKLIVLWKRTFKIYKSSKKFLMKRKNHTIKN